MQVEWMPQISFSPAAPLYDINTRIETSLLRGIWKKIGWTLRGTLPFISEVS